ncbi:MAG: Smr/MutS family protein [Saprospiraceae bacterium]|nr:Smr/MutS family protein [Saprospiraceae bacterium]
MLAIGTKVRIRFTGETATVTSWLNDGMVQLRLDDDPDFLIPAFEEDLDKLDSLSGSKPSFVPAGKAPPPPPPPPDRRRLKLGKPSARPDGLQLCFEPMPGRDESVSRYKMWLLNDTPHEFLFEIDVFSTERDIFFLEEMLDAASMLELGDFLADDLNAAPEVIFSIQRITTAGPDDRQEKDLKIKAKTFFNALYQVPMLSQPVHRFVLMSSFDNQDKSAAGPSLQELAKQQARKIPTNTRGNSMPFKAFNIEEMASFVPEIDLHIEALVGPGASRLDKGEILRIQLLHLRKFLDRAERLGASHIFVIHGVGEGKLKDAVATMLREDSSVRKFKNEFHHKYGYGATEVIFY